MENLNQQYLKQLQDLVEGNERFGKDVIEESHKVFDAKLHFEKVLSFDGELIEVEKITGGDRCNLHFVTMQDLEKGANVFIEQARLNKDLRQNVFYLFENNAIQTLKEHSDQKIIFHEFEKMSLKETCVNCSGQGYTTHTEKTTFKAKEDIFGNIQITQTGGGTYARDCPHCGATGYFMRYFFVQAIIHQKFWIRVECDEYAMPLQKYLATCSTRFIAERASLTFVRSESREKDASFHYEAHTPLMEFNFHIQTKKHTPLTHKALTFSNPPFAFQRPPIFDRFFTDELELLLKINADGKITQKEALTFFKKFQGQPVLDQAMKNIVKLKTEDNENLKSGVLNACQNYMSDDRAQAFSNLISLTLDRLAPGHSKKLWEMGSIVCAIIMFIATTSLGFAIASDIDWVEGFFLTILALCSWFVGIAIWGILLIIPLFFILFFILILLSYGSAFFIRRQLSEEYRQGFKDFRILLKSSFQKYCTIGTIAGFVFSGIFGVIF